MIEPIGIELQRPVLAATERYFCEAEQIFDRRFKRIPVLFDLRGTSAGMYKVLGKRRWIRYNPWIFAKYYDLNVRDTVPMKWRIILLMKCIANAQNLMG